MKWQVLALSLKFVAVQDRTDTFKTGTEKRTRYEHHRGEESIGSPFHQFRTLSFSLRLSYLMPWWGVREHEKKNSPVYLAR